MTGCRAQQPVLKHQAAAVQPASDDVGQVLGGEGLFEKVIGTGADCTHCKLNVAVAGDKDYRDVGIDVVDTGQECHPVEAGHPDIADHHAAKSGRDVVERLFRARELVDSQTGKFQCLCGGVTDVLFVVNEQHAGRFHCAASNRSGNASASSSTVTTAPPSGCCSTV